MNGVCTNIIHLDQQTLKYYGGNYDTFIKTKLELEESQEKRYQWEQDQIAHMKVSLYRSLCRIMNPLFRYINISILSRISKWGVKFFYYYFYRIILHGLVMVAQNLLVKHNRKRRRWQKWLLKVWQRKCSRIEVSRFIFSGKRLAQTLNVL